MIANLLIIAFVLGMAYIWSVYGLFSAFLQLVIVVAAGAVAFAVWEPLVLGFLIGRMPSFAWGVGLLGPFVLALILMRTGCDVVVRQNVHFPRLVSGIGGGACGLASGILVAGIAWVGINFMPLQPSIAGAQNYQVDMAGQVVDAPSALWFRVDRMAVNFYNGLSGGAFSTDKPLHLYQPDLAWQAGVYRLQTDPNASLVARPAGVDAVAVHAAPANAQGIDPVIPQTFNTGGAAAANSQFVLVDTRWTLDPGTYDSDRAVRIAPSQVRLVVFEGPARDPRPVLVAPRGYSTVSDFQSGARTFHPLTGDRADIRSNQQSETIGFVFLVPADAQPQFILIRHLRVDLPQVDVDLTAFVTKAGSAYVAPPEPEPADPAAATTPAAPAAGAWSGQYAQAIELTNQLPSPFNRNNASALRYVADSTAIESGESTVSGRVGGLAARTRVDSIFIPSHQAAVRVKVAALTASSIFGQALNTARSAGGVWLTDERGQQHQPIAYVLHQGDQQVIRVNLSQPIQSANQLPTSQMTAGQSLYLYFAIPKPTKLTEFHIGDRSEPIDPPIEAQ